MWGGGSSWGRLGRILHLLFHGDPRLSQHAHVGKRIGWFGECPVEDRCRVDKWDDVGLYLGHNHPQALEQSVKCQYLLQLSTAAQLPWEGHFPPHPPAKTAQSQPILRPLSGYPEACIWVLGSDIPWLWMSNVNHSCVFDIWPVDSHSCGQRMIWDRQIWAEILTLLLPCFITLDKWPHVSDFQLPGL